MRVEFSILYSFWWEILNFFFFDFFLGGERGLDFSRASFSGGEDLY